MENIPEEVKNLIYYNCDLYTLLQISKINKKHINDTQRYIFKFNHVHYNKNIRYYNLNLISKINNCYELTNDDLKKIPNLIELDLKYNKITENGIRYLRKISHNNIIFFK